MRRACVGYRPRRDRRPSVQLDDLGRVPDLVAALAAAGVRLTRVEPHEPTLEDLYFAVRRGRAGVARPPRRPSTASTVSMAAAHRAVGTTAECAP